MLRGPAGDLGLALGAIRVALLALGLAALLWGCAGGQTQGVRGTGAGREVAEAALEQEGRPYRYGAADPDKGFDCSGLALWAHRQVGVKLPRSAREQAKGGRKIGRDSLRPGDLVFFDISGRKARADHVGVWIGQGSFVHAPSSGGRVRRDRLEEPYWRRRYLTARRWVR